MKPVGTSSGPYVDLPLNVLGVFQVNNRSNSARTPSESAAFFADAGTSSVLESGSIEQPQTGVAAASTVKMLNTWAQSGASFDINNSAISGDDLGASAIRRTGPNPEAPMIGKCMQPGTQHDLPAGRIMMQNQRLGVVEQNPGQKLGQEGGFCLGSARSGSIRPRCGSVDRPVGAVSRRA